MVCPLTRSCLSVGLSVLAAAALPARAQPVWTLDLPAAQENLTLAADALALGSMTTGCTGPDIQRVTTLGGALTPGYTIGVETFDFGAAALATATSSAIGLSNARTGASAAVRGLGTASVVLHFRVFTQHDSSGTVCAYSTAGRSEVAALFPLLITGGGGAYRVSYRAEFTASAATTPEAPAAGEDVIYVFGGLDLTSPTAGRTPVLEAGFYTPFPPNSTGGTQVRTGSFDIAAGHPDTNPLPTILVGLGAFMDDVMASPGVGPSRTDASSGEFTVRCTLTIGQPLAAGACCIGLGCTSTTPTVCAGLTGQYRGDNAPCQLPVNSLPACCPANFNTTGGLTIQDCFDFLTAYFAGDPRADFDGSTSISVQDVLDYFGAFFTGC